MSRSQCHSITKIMVMATSLKYRTESLSVRSEEHTSSNSVVRRTPCMQCAGKFEVVHCCHAIKHAHTQRVFMHFFTSTVDDSCSNVASALSDSRYLRMSLARPFVM